MGAHVIRLEVNGAEGDADALSAEIATALHKRSVPLRLLEYLGYLDDEPAPVRDVTGSDSAGAGATDGHS